MLGFFGIFGRSQELRQLDQALRRVDLHPRLVPESVKLAMLKLVQEASFGNPSASAFEAAGELVGYCMLGPDDFVRANGADLAAGVEVRLGEAIDAQESLDARLVLLLIYARQIQPAVVERFGLEAG
jgi:hypothetical protein